jgi:hypothetical protein
MKRGTSQPSLADRSLLEFDSNSAVGGLRLIDQPRRISFRGDVTLTLQGILMFCEIFGLAIVPNSPPPLAPLFSMQTRTCFYGKHHSAYAERSVKRA